MHKAEVERLCLLHVLHACGQRSIQLIVLCVAHLEEGSSKYDIEAKLCWQCFCEKQKNIHTPGQVSKWQNKTPPEDGVWTEVQESFFFNSTVPAVCSLAGGGGGDTRQEPQAWLFLLYVVALALKVAATCGAAAAPKAWGKLAQPVICFIFVTAFLFSTKSVQTNKARHFLIFAHCISC